jgi:pimeloyl-ACP methyl ester carboxylesterase
MAESSHVIQSNSTNVRPNNHRGIGAIRLGFACLGAIAPNSTVGLAAYLFGKPKRVGIRPEAEATMAAAHRFDLDVDDMSLAAWSWGDGPTIILHHGWGGRASQMWRFVSPLVDAGYSVVAYDSPAHGDSPGSISSLPETARALRAAAFRLNGIHGVISHSFGCAATLFAIRHGLRLERAVLLAPPSDMNYFIDHYVETVGLNPNLRRAMERSWIARYRFSWEDMDVRGWANGKRPPLLVFHDRDDIRVPWEQGDEIVREWGNAELVTMSGVGHSRIREDERVAREAASFLTAS